jgi:hypothetical protein
MQSTAPAIEGFQISPAEIDIAPKANFCRADNFLFQGILIAFDDPDFSIICIISSLASTARS